MTAGAIVNACRGRGNRAQCPACAADGRDKARNHLAVSERGGTVLVHCFSGCTQADVIDGLRRLGVWPARERHERTREDKRRWAEATNLAARVGDWARGKWLNLETAKRGSFQAGDDRLLAVAARALYTLENAQPAELIRQYRSDGQAAKHEQLGRDDREHVNRCAELVVRILGEVSH